MIYGYSIGKPLNEYGLLRLESATLAFGPRHLRALSDFLAAAATTLEKSATHDNWHLHFSKWAKDAGLAIEGWDIVVTGSEKTTSRDQALQ